MRIGFYSSVTDGSFAILVVPENLCLGDSTVSCPLLVFWFHGFFSGRPPSSGLLVSERSSYHIVFGCLSSLNCTRYALLVCYTASSSRRSGLDFSHSCFSLLHPPGLGFHSSIPVSLVLLYQGCRHVLLFPNFQHHSLWSFSLWVLIQSRLVGSFSDSTSSLF